MDLEATACSQRGCAERHDFLPFTCNGCNKKFCLDHHKSEQHSCPVPSRDDKYAPTCPMCQQAVTIKPGENANQVIDAHIRAGCQVVTAKSKKNPCSFAGCKEKEFIPVSCKLCKQPFCLKHRFETDHPCPKNGNTKGNGGGLFKAPPAKAAAGAAAVARAAVQQQDDLRVARAAQYHDHLTASQVAAATSASVYSGSPRW
ncbi:hypothetical protein T484DRAFT_1822453 [Baffinella frigidus]|nr:hypothetical protein T484DRAFT_1822453 [Cryptophyta sp. CCMP2293]